MKGDRLGHGCDWQATYRVLQQGLNTDSVSGNSQLMKSLSYIINCAHSRLYCWGREQTAHCNKSSAGGYNAQNTAGR